MRKCQRYCVEVLVARMIGEVASNHCFHAVVKFFRLPISMEGTGHLGHTVGVQYLADTSKKVSAGASINVEE